MESGEIGILTDALKEVGKGEKKERIYINIYVSHST